MNFIFQRILSMKNTTDLVDMEDVRNDDAPAISIQLTVTLVVINIVAIVVNMSVVIIIFALYNLRKNASYVHAVCLCLASLLASMTAVHKLLVLSGTVSCLDTNECTTVNKFLETFSAFTVILDIVAMNIDKFYAIQFTFHYTNNVTRVNAAALHIISFIVVAGFSIIPIFAQNEKQYGDSLHVINYSQGGNFYACVMLVCFFAVPVVAMTLVSVSIYLVARRTLMKVSPAAQFVCQIDSERKSTASRRANTMQSVAQIDKTCSSENVSKKGDDQFMQAVKKRRRFIENEESFCEQNSKLETECENRTHQYKDNLKTFRSGLLPPLTFLTGSSTTPSSCSISFNTSPVSVIQGQPKRSASTVGCQRNNDNNPRVNSFQSPTMRQRKPRNCKAVINLTYPIVYFLLVWGPFFTINFMHNVYNAFEADIIHDFIYVICVMINLSFALNPVVFVIYRRDFREEVVAAVERLRGQPEVVADMSAENSFEQFLRTTSHI